MNHPSARKAGPVILIALTVVMLLCSLLFPARAAAQPVSPAQLAGDFNFVVMSGNVAKVREMVALHPELVTNNAFGVGPPLVQAAEFGQGDLVDFLVTNGADVNAHGVWGRTALFFAANNGDARLVRFLLDHHADVNARDDNQLTPLIQSIKSVEVIQLLLAHGADLNAHGGANTLFSQAVENPQSCGPGVIPFILTNGVDVTVSGQEGLYQAVLFGRDTNLVKMLVPCYAASTNPAALPLVRGAFGEALYNNRESMVVAMLSAFVQQQTNALQKAVALGDDPAIRSLVATNPALVNIKDFLGWTPLHVAALTGQATVAERLLSAEADPNLQDDLGNTPLHWTAVLGDRAVAEVLLRPPNTDAVARKESLGDLAPADVLRHYRAALDAAGSFGNSPLLLALQYDHPAVAELLITNGAIPITSAPMATPRSISPPSMRTSL